MVPVAELSTCTNDLSGELGVRPSGLFLARVSTAGKEPRRARFAPTAHFSRESVFDMASAAHSVARSLEGLGMDVQVAMLDEVRCELEAGLVADLP